MKYESLIQETIAYLNEKGLSQVEVQLTESNDFEIGGGNNDINLVRSLENAILKVSAIKDFKKSSIEMNDLSPNAWEMSLTDLILNIDMAEADEYNVFSSYRHQGEHRQTVGAQGLESAWIAEVTAKGITELKQAYPKIAMSEFSAMYEQKQTLLKNTNGTHLYEQKGDAYFGGLFFASEEGKTASFNYYSVPLQNVQHSVLENEMFQTLLANNVKELSTTALEGRIEGGIILSPSCLFDVLSSLESIGLKDMSILDDSSRWKGKIGQKVASESLTWHSCPISSPVGGNYGITEDGYPAQDMTVIENGVLNTYMLTEYVANKTGLERAKNQGGIYLVEAGNQPLESIISGIERGMVLNRISGGRPSPNGDFSGSAKNSFLIENGKVTDALTEVMVTFNVFEVLMNIVALSSETADMVGGRLPYLYANAILATGK